MLLLSQNRKCPPCAQVDPDASLKNLLVKPKVSRSNCSDFELLLLLSSGVWAAGPAWGGRMAERKALFRIGLVGSRERVEGRPMPAVCGKVEKHPLLSWLSFLHLCVRYLYNAPAYAIPAKSP